MQSQTDPTNQGTVSIQDRQLTVAISGASGFVGSRLVPYLAGQGHGVRRLVRGEASRAGEIAWDPKSGQVDLAALNGVDAVVHLAGEGIAAGRWTNAMKERIRSSRTQGTRTLAQALAGLERRPQVLVSASAIGYYGDRGDDLLTESSPPGDTFLSRVCQEWEQAAQPAREAGIRVVNLRIGVVLSPAGGALSKMMMPFRMGLGGVVGSGRQYVSWISLQDVLRVIEFVMVRDDIAGPVNAVSPNPATNRELTHAVGRWLNRPTLVPLPSFMVRVAFGQMGEETLLAGARLVPEKLLAHGFVFEHPDLNEALRDEARAAGL